MPLEIEAEKAAVEQSVEEYKKKKESGETSQDGNDDDIDLYRLPPEMTEEDRMAEAMMEGKEQRYTSHVPIPSQKDIEDALLHRKKQELMQMYALDEFDEVEGKPEKKRAKK